MRAALLLLASLATIALQANACDVKGPIDIMGDKCCSWKGEGDVKVTCLKCVKKIFKNEGDCEYNKVKFPPGLDTCQLVVGDKDFVAKMNKLSIDKYVDKLESMLEQIPKLKSQFCCENKEFENWMKDDEASEESIGDQMKKSEIGQSIAEGMKSPAVAEALNAFEDVGCTMATNNVNNVMKKFKVLIAKICGDELICTNMKGCLEEMLGYVVNYATRRRRKRWLEERKTREALSRETII